MEENNAIECKTLKPDDDNLWYVLAHRWTQDRPRFFPHTGGFDFLADYLDQSKQDNQIDVGIFENGIMISLVTIIMEDGDAYLMHVTSPKGSDSRLITAATYQIGWGLFDLLNAEYIYTMVPTFNGHVHKGSKALAENCGLTPYGEPEIETDGRMSYSWQAYALTRENWTKYHGKTENTAVAV